VVEWVDGDGDKLMMDRYCLRIRRARMLRIIRGRWMLRRRGLEGKRVKSEVSSGPSIRNNSSVKRVDVSATYALSSPFR